MSTPEPRHRREAREFWRRLPWPRLERRKPPPPRKGGEPEREPVEPHNPKPLSGGAAAELEFDD
jgi:hypothetical protein